MINNHTALTTTDVGTQGLNFANDAGGGTVTNLSTAQPITIGTHTWVLEMDTTGNWSYSIDGATPTTGTIAGGFDPTRDYHFLVFCWISAGTCSKSIP